VVTPPYSADDLRPDLRVVEASASRERACAECGQRTAAWKPVRRRGVAVVMCAECAAKLLAPEAIACPSCEAALSLSDRFCGKCGTSIEYGCPACGATVDPKDSFCGKCGTRIAS
jgi:predicted amidophosphoribosyltransferase